MILTQQQLDAILAGTDVDYDLPDNPGPTSDSGIFFENVFFSTQSGDASTTPQGELTLDILGDFGGFTDENGTAAFVARNAQVTVGDDFGTAGSIDSVFSISGPSASLDFLGLESSGSAFRIASFDGGTTSATFFVSDGANVTIDHSQSDRAGSISLAVSFGAFQDGDDVQPGGQSVDGTLVIEGDGTTVSIVNTAGGEQGFVDIARIDQPVSDGLVDTTTNRTADGFLLVRDGAELNVLNAITVGDANGIDGASAHGAFVVEGAQTSVTVGGESGIGRDGFMRVADEGGTGLFVLREGAQFNLLSGEDFGGGLQLSGGSTRNGGEATAIVVGADTRLFVEDGSIDVGRNGGEADLVLADGASIQARNLNTARNSVGTTTIEGDGTELTLSDGSQGNLQVAQVDQASVDATGNSTAVGTVTIRDGASVNVRSFVGVADENGIDGASATGTLIVEGAQTSVTVGDESRTERNGFMRVAEEGGNGTFIVRDGAEFRLLSGDTSGASIQLSGASDRDGGEATVSVSGTGSKLLVEKGSIEVGRNGGQSTFTASDGASVEALFFNSGREGEGHTVFEGEGTTLNLSGAQVTPEFGAFLTVARDAEGSFTVRDGADVSITGDGGTFPGFQVGRNDGSLGVVTVTGAGSTITVDGANNVEEFGGETGFIRAGNESGSDGTINVLDGGVISNEETGVFFVAQREGSTGHLNVDGAGSVFDFGAAAFFSEDAPGARGNAVVTVSNGGLLRGDSIENNGILDITSGGMLQADLVQDNILLSSAGVEDLMIDGDLRVETAGFGFDFSTDTNAGFIFDTYNATGDVALEGRITILADSFSALSGRTAEIITGASLNVSDDFVVEFVEFDAGELTEVDSAALISAAANAVALEFMTFDTGLTVDFGTSAEQSGSDVAETFAGSAYSDILSGLGGDDTLTGGGGNDELNGGEGVDTGAFSGSQTSYTLTLAPGLTTLTDRRAEGNGTDTLIDLEFLDFDVDLLDGPFDLSVFAGPAGLEQAQLETFVELYIAYFNRAPDAVGLNFWGTAFANGTSLEEMATLFIDQDETRDTYPSDLSNAEFATAVYNNVLGRVPDQAGFDFWVGVLDEGSVGRDQFILEVLGGARAAPPGDAEQAFVDQQMADQQFLSNKTDIGAYFSVVLGMSDVQNASDVMALFDGTQSSLDAAVAATDAFFVDAQDAENGEFLMPIVGVLDDPFQM